MRVRGEGLIKRQGIRACLQLYTLRHNFLGIKKKNGVCFQNDNKSIDPHSS